MKNGISIIVALCFFALLITGCEKNLIDYGDVVKVTEDQPIIKINYACPYRDDKFVIVRFNGKRVTSKIQNRTPFPGGGYNTRGDVRADYLTIDPGLVRISIAVPFKKENGMDSVELYAANVNIGKGKRYVIHFADTSASTKHLLTEENFLMPDSGYATYRFVNLMPNVPAVDLYYGQSATVHTQDVLVAPNVGYLSAGAYFTLNRYSARTWKIRKAGDPVTAATVLANYTSASALLNQRTYTVYAHGYAGLTSATEKPYVSFFHIR